MNNLTQKLYRIPLSCCILALLAATTMVIYLIQILVLNPTNTYEALTQTLTDKTT